MFMLPCFSEPIWFIRGFEGFHTELRQEIVFSYNPTVVNSRSSEHIRSQHFWRNNPLIIYDRKQYSLLVDEIEDYVSDRLSQCGGCNEVEVIIIAYSRGAIVLLENLINLASIPSINLNIFTIDPIRFNDQTISYTPLNNVHITNYYQEYGHCNASGFITDFIGGNCRGNYRGVAIENAENYTIYNGPRAGSYIYHQSMVDHSMLYISQKLTNTL